MRHKLALWLAALTLVTGLLILTVFLIARGAVPFASGHTRIAALAARVEIVRDRHAIPHVFAQHERDAYLGLGYAHAQDRLWQMDLARRVASGTLSELVGERGLEADKLFRTLDLARLAEENVRTLDAATRAALAGYTAGINAFLQEDRALPVEFKLLGSRPGPWRDSDSLAIFKLMAWRLSGNWDAELGRMRLGSQLSPQQLAEFTAPFSGAAPIALEPLWQLYDQLGLSVVSHTHRDAGSDAVQGAFEPRHHSAPGESDTAGRPRALRALRALASELRRFAPSNFGRAVGSNNWAVDGRRTVSGKPLLANDPHLELTAPSQWYFAQLHAPGLNVVGATIPGLPGVILGRNDKLAWAFTNTLPDTEDVYFEKLVQGDASAYQTPRGNAKFELTQHLIRVRGGADVALTVRRTRHGPVISDLTAVARESVPDGFVLALSWTGLRTDDQTPSFPVRAAHAADAAALREAARSFHSPAQNIVYADVAGAVGFVAAGRVPVRGAANTLRGLVPAPGWLDGYDWQGLVPFEALPQLMQPSSGRIVTANQDITPPGYATWLGADWGPPYRADRIGALLDARSKHDGASFAAIQGDVHSAVADLLLGPMLSALGPPSDDHERRLIEGLREWKRDMRADAREPLLFASWLRELTRLVYQDELGALFEDEWSPRPEFLAHVLEDRDGQARWCDDRRSSARELCAEQVRTSFTLALSYLGERFGRDSQAWRWGPAHPSIAAHPLFGSLPVLSRWFNVELPRGGDGSTVDVGAYELIDDNRAFESTWGSGFRTVYDLHDLERSMGILNTGQSGHVLSPHYRDMAERWARGQNVPLITTRERVEVGALGTWELEPVAR